MASRYSLKIELPPSFDASPKHEAALRQYVSQVHGEDWSIDRIDLTSRIAHLSKEGDFDQIDIQKLDGQSVTSRLPSGVKVEEYRQQLQKQYGDDFELVSYNPLSGAVTYRQLNELESQVIRNLGKQLRMSPWEMNITTHGDGSMVISLPDGYSPTSDEKLQELVTASVGNHTWAIFTKPAERRAILKETTPPTFSKIIKPNTAKGDPKDWGRMFVGEALGTFEHPKPQPLFTDFAEAPHMLVSGTTGGGKSVFIANVITQALLKGWDVAIVEPSKQALDFKRFKPWIKPGWFGDNLEGAEAITREIREMVDVRYTRLGAENVTNWLESKSNKIKPTLLVVDELSALFAHIDIPKGLPKDDPDREEMEMQNTFKAKIQSHIQEMLWKSRAAGVFVLLATQIANQTTGVPTAIRNVCGCRVLMGKGPTETMRQTSLINADAAPTVPEWLDPAVSRGVGVFELDGKGAKIFRSVYIGLDEVPHILADCEQPLNSR